MYSIICTHHKTTKNKNKTQLSWDIYETDIIGQESLSLTCIEAMKNTPVAPFTNMV